MAFVLAVLQAIDSPILRSSATLDSQRPLPIDIPSLGNPTLILHPVLIMSQPTNPLPHYRRSNNPPPLQLTERDVRMLEHIYALRLLDREQLQRLEFTVGGASACKRRLTLLFHNGYVDRRYAPRTVPYGSPRSAYCLDRRGAELLAARRGLRVDELDWRRDDAVREVFFLSHTLATNDVYVALAGACASLGYGFEWLSERALRRELSGQLVRVGGAADLPAPIPDAHVTLVAPDGTYGFAVELDRGSVEEKRIRQKVHAYGAWLGSGAYGRRFPDAALRVLFMVAAEGQSEARLARLVRWCEAERGASLFWFAEHRRLIESDILRDAIWRVAGGDGLHALLPGGNRGVTIHPPRPLLTIR